ncbi:cell division protein SepF [Porcipelethomonas sp.]|uniref:cell division protein SepF n=1 Tax=Porcipelethomonas sp. TaxID=2981675 RepID=UPI003EFAB692
MDIFKNIKDFFVPPEDGDEQYEEVSHSRPRQSSSHHTEQRDSDYEDSRGYRAERFDDTEEKRNKVVNIQATAQLQVVLVKPEVFTDAKQIADHLIAKKTVVLNLETASPENKRRIIDFLVGVAYANGGSLKPVANMTYIITPYNVGFVGEDLVGELENNGVII